MNTKQKAKDIVKKMYLVHSNSESAITHHFAKQCALIAVDEILDMNDLCEKMGTYTIFFWQEVKEEIKKL